jgi:CBS domain-containing membrane protein
MKNGDGQGKRIRACLGALFGIAFTGWVAHAVLGSDIAAPLLVAPMGASAVLLFAVPESPLAQPWSIMGGNICAAIVGVVCAKLIGTPVVAAATAVALAISVMLAFRCVHPPSGAVALTAVLGGPAIHELGYRFVLIPIALQSAALLTAALAFHLAMGHRYPRSFSSEASHASAGRWNGLRQRLSSMLRWRGGAAGTSTPGASASSDPAGIEALLHDDGDRFGGRVFGELTCADIMSALPHLPHLPHLARASSASHYDCTVRTDTPISELAPHFKDHACDRVGVLDGAGRLVGAISQLDLIWGLYRQMRTPQGMAA